jgi:tyrosinase
MLTRERSYISRMVVRLLLQLGTQALTKSKSDLSSSQRCNCIKAVLCLGEKPARTLVAIAAGARSRHDDFVVTHIQQTRTIHFTVRLANYNSVMVLKATG